MAAGGAAAATVYCAAGVAWSAAAAVGGEA